MRSRATAVGTATVLASLGLGAASMPIAAASGPVPPARTSPAVPTLARSTAALGPAEGGPAEGGPVRAAALQTTSSASLAAVTFVNEELVDPATLDVTVTEAGTSVGELQIATGRYTAPQLLPAGTYTVGVTDAATGAAEATDTLAIAAGSDTSEVISGYVGTAGAAVVQVHHANDAVGTVAAGQSVLSVRNETQGALDVYLNGSLAVSDATGATLDVALSPGDHQVDVVDAGAGAAANPVYSGFLSLAADSYVPLYLVEDPSQSGGVNAGTTPFRQGYQYAASDGGLFNYGAYPFLGSTGNITLQRPVVGGAEATDGSGYWLVASDGGVFAFGAPFLGSLGDITLDAPIVGMAATIGPDGKPGYLLVASDGGVFAFNAAFHGSLGGTGRTDVVGIAADPSTGGYVIAEANGSYTQFGPGITPSPTAGGALNRPIVGITETPDGGGAWLVAADGGVFNIGDAPFLGSTGGMALNRPVVGLFATFDGLGYYLVAADGGVFSYGDARFFGSTGNITLNQPVVGAVIP
jgi:hypothetical protein